MRICGGKERKDRSLGMHEFSTMEAILKTVIKVAEEHGAEEILQIELAIGELTFLNFEQLRFAFQALSEGTIAEGASLLLHTIKPEIYCPKCGYKGKVKYEGPEQHTPMPALMLKCPKCGNWDVKIRAGRECIIKSVKLRVQKR